MLPNSCRGCFKSSVVGMAPVSNKLNTDKPNTYTLSFREFSERAHNGKEKYWLYRPQLRS